MNKNGHKIALFALVLVMLLGTFSGVTGAATTLHAEGVSLIDTRSDIYRDAGMGIDLNADEPLIPVPPLADDSRLFKKQPKLWASDRAYFINYGGAVAIDGDTALIGASMGEANGITQVGAVYVFVRTDGAWTQQARLVASDGEWEDAFGWSVALDGDTALIGAVGYDLDDDCEVGCVHGAAYVFVRDGVTWTEQAKLTADDLAPESTLGASVALAGDTALIGVSETYGSQGAAYVFVRDGTTWAEQARLTASDGGADDNFGTSVALDGDNALIGALTGVGSAYVFVRDGVTWTEQAKLTASDGSASDHFGERVALDSNTALVAALYDDTGDETDQGAAYVFVRDGVTWTEQAKLVASDGSEGDHFGYALALDGDIVLAGVPYEQGTGAVYVYARSGGLWTQGQKLSGTKGEIDDRFGSSAAVSGSTILVGAPMDTHDVQKELKWVGSGNLFVELDMPGTELLTNGGFEAIYHGALGFEPWSLNQGTQDRLKCDKPDIHLAYNGGCLFLFKGRLSENSLLQQFPDLNGIVPAVGDTLDFSFYIKGGSATQGRVRVSVVYGDGTPSGKFVANLTPSDVYKKITGQIVLTSAAVSKLKVRFEHLSRSGIVFIDEVSLRYVAGGGGLSLVPVPGMRR